MARFVIIAFLASNPITYLYEEPEKALAKARTLQRQMASFELRNGVTNTPITLAALEELVRRV